MRPTKNPFQSKTIWGAIITGIGLLGRVTGMEVPADEIRDTVDILGSHWDDIATVIGIGVTIYGRWTADKQVRLSPGN